MPPRREIWDEHVSLWGQAEPAKVGPPRPKDLNRTAKFILKIASISSTITAVIILIFVITAFTFISSSSNKANDRPALNVDQSTLNTISEYLLAYKKNIQGKPIGSITLSPNGAASANRIKISGYTKNIPEGYLVVIAAGVGWLRLCWHKKPFIHPTRLSGRKLSMRGSLGHTWCSSMRWMKSTTRRSGIGWMWCGLGGCR